jgi:hypothetical protein
MRQQAISIAVDNKRRTRIPEFDPAVLEKPEIALRAAIIRGDGESAFSSNRKRCIEGDGVIAIERQPARAGPGQCGIYFDVFRQIATCDCDIAARQHAGEIDDVQDRFLCGR